MKFYEIDGKRFETAEDATQHIIDNAYFEDEFDEMLDECYEEIDICGIKYAPSIVLYRVDEIAYNCALSDYIDSRYSDILYELERLWDGDTEEFYGFTVEVFEEEDEEDAA